MKLYLGIILLALSAVVGWQQVYSLQQELAVKNTTIAVKDATIANPMVSLRPNDKPPETVIVEKPVEKIIYKTVYLDRQVEVPITLTDWISLDELKAFLANDMTDQTIFYRLSDGARIKDCDDYAIMLRDKAVKQGKYIGLQRITPTEFTSLTGMPWYGKPEDVHMLNNAVVDGVFYYIEPQSDQVFQLENLD